MTLLYLINTRFVPRTKGKYSLIEITTSHASDGVYLLNVSYKILAASTIQDQQIHKTTEKIRDFKKNQTDLEYGHSVTAQTHTLICMK